ILLPRPAIMSKFASVEASRASGPLTDGAGVLLPGVTLGCLRIASHHRRCPSPCDTIHLQRRRRIAGRKTGFFLALSRSRQTKHAGAGDHQDMTEVQMIARPRQAQPEFPENPLPLKPSVEAPAIRLTDLKNDQFPSGRPSRSNLDPLGGLGRLE